MNEIRLIDADALKEAMRKAKRGHYSSFSDITLQSIYQVINNAPTVPLPDFKAGYKQAIIDGKTNFSRPQGEWIIDGHHIRCNKCNEYICNADREGNKIPDNFCPNCGAKMT